LNAQRPREKEAVHDFFRYHLDRIVSPPTKFEIPKDLDPDKLALLQARALAAAICGDVTNLRLLVSHFFGPEFADYIQPMKLERGKKYPPLPNLSWVIVDLVKSIQQMHYKKRPYYRSHKGDWHYVEEVAARYLGVSELEKSPLLYRKKSRKKNSRKKNPRAK
jgi:hypothetical protein